MPKHHHQTFNQQGELIEEIIEEIPDQEPSLKELAREKIQKATTIATLQQAMLEYLEAEGSDE